MFVCKNVHVSAGVRGGQKKELVELQVSHSLRVSRSKLGFSARALGALTHRDMSPAP